MFNNTTKKKVNKNTSEAMNNFQRSTSENKFIKVMLFITVLSSALTYNEVNQLAERQQTVLVPYGAKSSEMLITGESASTGYMRQIGRLLVSDYGSVSKASVDNRFADLLSLAWPDRVEDLRVKLNERAKYFKQFNSVSHSMELAAEQPMAIITNPEISYKTDAKNKYRYTFTVEQRKIIGEVAHPVETRKMKIDYTIQDGRFWLLDIE
ncbi:TraE/TraK family type IV conjugative transfer system protein [Enterobacter hormaechei]|uniref:TraE/TraK family type IV conjugative transfer system protein n=1 Tax=Enterobacter hormaechei TaxID=158836 RepID=UPI001258E303|nr:TraE/TraK family type IV conjugative transfer system protein [Enterobacter hormaechei]EDK1561890.1 hypothetical protein [Salmonella enterica subsp. enterica serovar Newport]EKK9105918.1 hypothetical protein [Salmonella enterica]VAK79311.1 conjugal transfer pilus assembly protein TraE [Enterobacter cloacae]